MPSPPANDAIPAATLVLIRDRAAAPPELLMIERAADMAFAGGAMVFPGGRIDPGDHTLAADPALIMGAPADPLEAAARIAAIRETLEETGVAIGFDPAPDPAAAVQLREALHEGGDLGAMLASGRRLDLSMLIPWSRWRPSFRETRIFDTFFFVARAPEGGEAVADGGESVALRWASARDVLSEAEAGECQIIFPTRRNLERLAEQPDFATAASHARAHPVRTITPFIEERDGERWLCIPPDGGYPIAAEPLARARRGMEPIR